MRVGIRIVQAALVALAVAALAGPGRAGESAKADIDAALGVVEAERWEAGEVALRKVFTHHEGAAEARAELPRIEEALKLCLFRKGRRAPDAFELFGNEVKRFQHGARTIQTAVPITTK